MAKRANAAGYSGSPLVKKLGLKEGVAAFVDNPPEDYFDLLVDCPEVHWKSRPQGRLDFAHLFSVRRTHLEKRFALLAGKLASDGMLWVSWPKKSSGVATEVDEAVVRRTGLDAGLVDVKICAVDATWSALKFVYRLKDR